MKINHLLSIILLIFPLYLFAQPGLTAVEEAIARTHPVPNISADSLLKIIRSADSLDYLLLDTRKAEEFETSHLPKAIRVDPNITPEAFWQEFGANASRKNLVFYCSVGKRSSIMAEKLLQSQFQDSVGVVYNLRGGIFRWYNEGNTVVNAQGPTDNIHPYDRFWGKLIQKRR